jgi:hypothetical protein
VVGRMVHCRDVGWRIEMADENRTCRTCRYWQGILPKGKDTTWSGCMVGKNMLDLQRMLDADWVAEVGEDNLEVRGGNSDVVATREGATCSKDMLILHGPPPVISQGRRRKQVVPKGADPVQATLNVLRHHVYHKESPDEGLILDTLLNYGRDKCMAD